MAEQPELVPVRSYELTLGDPSPWPLYDRYGWLLLRAGAVLESQRQRDILIETGFRPLQPGESVDKRQGNVVRHRPRAPERDPNPFARFNRIGLRVEEAFRLLIEQRPHAIGLISALAKAVNQLVDQDADAALGAVHLAHSFPYAIQHPCQKATICEVVARVSGYDEERRKSLCCAALTANIGMLGLQETLEQQKTPITPEQRKEIQDHPLRSCRLLEAAGVEDRRWLQSVAQHHERTDGSGYPDGLKDDSILPEARMLALADAYSAMVTPREHRDAIDSRRAMRDIFLARGKALDGPMTELFIKTLGIHPPGQHVRLSNGEVAVVVRRGADSRFPQVASVRKPNGEPYLLPRVQQITETGLKIADVEHQGRQVWHIDLPTIWGYGSDRPSPGRPTSRQTTTGNLS